MKIGEKAIVKEAMLRFAAPNLYKEMIDVFSRFHIHPFDVHGTISQNKIGDYELSLRFSEEYSKSTTTVLTEEQVKNPDDEVIQFFKETAEKCKNQLISDYFKMVKP
jgi:hypothetical protein